MARILAALLLVISFSWNSPALAQSSNLLGRGAESGAAVESPRDAPRSEDSMITLPGWLSDLVGKTVLLQTKLNRQITATLREAKNGDSWWPGLMIIGLSFAYGVFHAAGPGHGKMVTTSYFLSRDAGWKQGVAMGTLIAGVQAIAAILLVGTLTMVLTLGPAAVTRNGLVMEAVSYALITVLGAVMCLRILQGRDDCCDHGSHPHEHEHEHDHDHTHGAPHQGEARAPSNRWQMIASGVVVGLRPCTGSILVLLFTLANGLFWIGIASAFAMAAGVALTISLIGIAAIGIRTGTQRLFTLSDATSGMLRRIVGFAGAGTITLFGGMLLMASARQLGWL